MKKNATLILLTGLVSLLGAHAQTNPAAATSSAGETNPPAAVVLSAPTNELVTSVTITNATVVISTNTVATTNETAAAAVAPATNVVAEAISSSTNSVAATAPAPAAETPAPAPAPAPATSDIPLIQFSDASLTTAIENLARRAGINYMLDPKIGYGQPDANGQIRVEPTLSIRWENISAENALLAMLDNYGLQLVVDKKTSIDRITLKDPLAPPPLVTRVVQLKYSATDKMTEAVQSVLTDKRSKVLPDKRTTQLIVVATELEQQAVDTLVAQLDKPTKQVLIETRLVEVSTNPKTRKGVDWTGTLQAQGVTFGNGNTAGSFTTTYPGSTVNDIGQTIPGSGSTTSGSTVTSVGKGGLSYNTLSGLNPATGFLNADGLSAVLSFLNTSADAQVMSTPRIVTLDNEPANIEVTRGYPVFTVQAGSQNAAGGSSVGYTNVGTKLTVTPRISANDFIWLKVIPEVSSFFGNFTQTVGGGSGGGNQPLTAPVFDVRKIETQVFIPNASTLVLGGLVQDSPRANYTKVPVLGDIPGLGYAFRSEEKELNKQNLLIFITPTIVKDEDFQKSAEGGEFLKSKSIKLKDPMNPNRTWDSPEAHHNWSDPTAPAK
jgi:type II secretory pathway component GspD/PulD (secretin)